MSRGNTPGTNRPETFAARASTSTTTTTMRTGTKLENHHHHRQPRSNDATPAEIYRSNNKESKLKTPLDNPSTKSAEINWDRTVDKRGGGGEKSVWSSTGPQSNGYGSNGTPSTTVSSSQPKSVTVLRPNRQSSDRENGATPSSSSAIVSGGGAGIDGAGDIGSSSIGGGSSSSSAFAAIARGAGSTSGWRKQGLGSAVPAPGLKPTVAVPVVPSGDENAFPALPSKSLLADPQQQQPLQQPPQQQQQRGSDSPKIIAGSVPTSISVKYAGRPVDKPTAAAAPSAVKTAPTLATAPVDYARKLMPIPKMMDSVKLVDEMFQWRGDDPLVLSRCGALLENPDFLVVGVAGPQGAGKSTLLAQLAGVKGDEKKPIFRIQSEDVVGAGAHQTSGIDMYITAPFGGAGCGGERVILLDTQALFSVSVLDNLIHHDRKFPTDFTTAENCVYMQSIHLLAWLLTTCHVVIIVQDWFMDVDLMKAVLTAEMLKPSLTPVNNSSGDKSKDEDKHSGSSLTNNEATLVFVQNKAAPEDMKRTTYAQIQRCIGSFFVDSKLNIGTAKPKFGAERAGGGGGRDGGGGGRSDGVYDGGGGRGKMSDVNLYFLPEMDNGNGRAAGPRFGLGPTPTGDFNREVNLLKRKILGLKRKPALFGSGSKPGGGNAVTEKTWLRQAGKIWEGMKKASLMLEYNRLLT